MTQELVVEEWVAKSNRPKSLIRRPQKRLIQILLNLYFLVDILVVIQIKYCIMQFNSHVVGRNSWFDFSLTYFILNLKPTSKKSKNWVSGSRLQPKKLFSVGSGFQSILLCWSLVFRFNVYFPIDHKCRSCL